MAKSYKTPPVWAKEIELFTVIDGLLYRRAPPSWSAKRKETQHKIVLPLSLRRLVLQQMHDENTTGHLAFIKTYNRVKKLFLLADDENDILQAHGRRVR